MASAFLRQIPGLRVHSQALSAGHYIGWLVVSLLALTTLPYALRLNVPVWELQSGQLMQVYASGIAYLMFSLVLFYACRLERGVSFYTALLFGAVCFFLSAGILFLLDDLEYSRLLLIACGAMGIVFALYPLVVNRTLLWAGTLLLLVVTLSIGMRMLLKVDDEGAGNQERVHSSLYVLDKVTFTDIPSMPEVDGGAIENYRDGFIAVTGDGQFYQLNWSDTADKLVVTKIPLNSPLLGRADFFASGNRAGLQFRVTDLLVRDTEEGDEIFVAHQIWNRAEDCFLMGLSRTILPQTASDGFLTAEPWTTVYETQPCIEQPFDTVETGGRLAWVGPDAILMTVGDHGSDGRTTAALSQEPNADYGKVLLLDARGNAEVFTSGHRNPQGLMVDKLGQVWLSEHGPAGGDELNLLKQGNNYGWPLVTYGTDYYKLTWPLNPDATNHGEFTEPVYAFVPSVAISNLIQLGGQQFPRWEGDFLVGSLRMETLYRVRMQDNRVIYVEPILVGARVRDLVEASDGRVLVWSDDESIAVLSRRVGPASGEDVYMQCRRCHEPVGKGKAIAPGLKGIVGRKVAALPDYPYSKGLRAAGGVWTEERLMQFLKNPQAFAPGTSMGNNRVSDDAERAALVEFLKNNDGAAAQ